jgi:3-oxocholest-4-en-26-oate---CoA ligase
VGGSKGAYCRLVYELNLAKIHEAVAAAVPDRECLVSGSRRFSWAEVAERTRRLANHLLGAGLGRVVDRARLAGHESGQDHVAIYLHNGNEYLETMLAAYKSRTVPVNVNYRYVAEELTHVLGDSAAVAIVYHEAFAPTLAEIRDELPALRHLVQVPDGSGHDLLPGAVDYEAALAAASPERPPVTPSPDDLYLLYTGGTTGLPKAVLWRQADIAVAAFGIHDADRREFTSLDAVVEAAARDGGSLRFLPTPPFMHGAGHWNAFSAWCKGHPVVIQSVTDRLDAADIWRTVERERVGLLLIVGDAFARPLIAELDRGDYDVSSLRIVLSGGAALSSPAKADLLDRLPGVTLIDGVGSSEAGGQMRKIHTAGGDTDTGIFRPEPDTVVLAEKLDQVLEPGHDGAGWLAKRGRIPLGYLHDEAKTAATFPVVDGVRYSVPGDRAVLRADGAVELRGRDSVTINTGGEKVFAEEVEAALMHHPAVWDCVVCGRPSARWGQEVVAIVQLTDGADATPDELLDEAGRHVARYKLPKEILFRTAILRSPSGKADYRWAAAEATT